MPSTWRDLPEELAPVFARRSTHRLFVALACGMVLADRSTAAAMAAAGGITGSGGGRAGSLPVRPGTSTISGWRWPG
jgi:hypothetical protein